jgi:hypothetical protein
MLFLPHFQKVEGKNYKSVSRGSVAMGMDSGHMEWLYMVQIVSIRPNLKFKTILDPPLNNVFSEF